MKTKLDDICDLAALLDLRDRGLVAFTRHPDGPYLIANYTHEGAYAGGWVWEKRLARGLIFQEDTLEVLARPWPKFFNLGEPDCPPLPDAPFDVSEKVDGSLGIVWRRPDTGEVEVATRGSFTSPQAARATAIWRERYRDVDVPDGVTLLVEIVYPENRIVVDYGDTEDLFFLGAVDIATGADVDDAVRWPGPSAGALKGFADVDELARWVASNPRPNAEGYVIRFHDGAGRPATRVKIKYPEYVQLHRVLTGIDSVRVWELAAVAAFPQADPRQLASALRLNPDEVERMRSTGDDPLRAVRVQLPDELWGWFDAQVSEIRARVAESERAYARAAEEIRRTAAAEGWDRRRVAEAVKDSGLHPGLLFAAVDDKPLWRTRLWLAAKPERTAPEPS